MGILVLKRVAGDAVLPAFQDQQGMIARDCNARWSEKVNDIRPFYSGWTFE